MADRPGALFVGREQYQIERKPKVNALALVTRSVSVALKPDLAFEFFTREMRRWWPFRGHSCSDENADNVEFEPRVGGAVTEISRDGQRYVWGTLTEWDPPRAFAMTWHPGLSETLATQLRVSFVVSGGGTLVTVFHDGWAARGEEADDKREGYSNGWAAVLGEYEAACRIFVTERLPN
jgi:uncharacterized protein YndB with AHSA1/START domain